MADEFGYTLEFDNYKFNYNLIYDELLKNITEYNPSKYEKIGELGVNPFDLFLLEGFIKENKISHVVEFGCGTTSKILDVLGVRRKTFALESIYYKDLVFDKINLFESYKLVQEYLDKNEVDLFLIDCEHSESMGKLIFERFIEYTDFKIPIFVHDWFDFGKKTYKEQIFYYKNIFNNYELYVMSDIPDEFLDKLKNKNNFLNNEYFIPRCSAILEPKKMKNGR